MEECAVLKVFNFRINTGDFICAFSYFCSRALT